MAGDIFQVDWVFVDTVIIVLLFLLLFGVKVFKATHRWRSFFSNEALERLYFPTAHKKIKNPFVFTKKWSFTRNSYLNKEFSMVPSILILRTKYKRKFLRILTEGLSSYGYNVINIKIKIKPDTNLNILNKKVMDEVKSFTSIVLDYFKQNGLITNSNYFLLNYSTSSIPYRAILSDSKNVGMILINPKLNTQNINNFRDIIKEFQQNTQLYTIFSKKSIFIIKNKNLKRFLKEIYPQKKINLKLLTLGKAKNSFKYYETIVLGMIIEILDNELLKTKI